jgi:hypothetical protein
MPREAQIQCPAMLAKRSNPDVRCNSYIDVDEEG